MTEPTSLAGTIDDGRSGTAVFSFYTGPVGIRPRKGVKEVGFLAAQVKAKLPIEGLLDGERVKVVAIETRDLNPDLERRPSRTAMRFFVATVAPVTPA